MKFLIYILALILAFQSYFSNAQSKIAPVEYDGHWGYMNTDGSWFIEPQYDVAYEAGGFGDFLAQNSDGLIRVRKRRSDGYYDLSGKLVIPIQFGMSRDFNEGVAVVVTKEGLQGVINTKGEYEIQPNSEFKEIRDFECGIAAVLSAETELWGFIDISGNWILEPQYRKTYEWNGNVGRVRDVEGVNYVDKNGTLLLEKSADWNSKFEDGVSRFKYRYSEKYDEIGFITSSGRIITTETKFTDAHQFSENLCAVKNSALSWGYIDTLGNVLIEPIFEKVRDFSFGLAAVKKEGKWTFIDRDGKVFKESYRSVKDFYHNIAAVRKGNRWGFIDRSGKIILDFQYEDVIYPHKDYKEENLIGVCKDYRCGYIDLEGNIRIEANYQMVREFKAGMAVVQLPKKKVLPNGDVLRKGWIYIDTSGSPVILPKGCYLKSFFEFSNNEN